MIFLLTLFLCLLIFRVVLTKWCWFYFFIHTFFHSFYFFGCRSPIGEYPFYLLFETSGSNLSHDEEKMNNFLESSLARGHILDGVVTNETGKVKQIWSIRELLPTAKINEKYFFKYDISVPLSRFYEIVPVMRERLGDSVYDVQGITVLISVIIFIFFILFFSTSSF